MIIIVYLSLRYQDLSGIELGTGLTLHGFFITFFFSPIKDPIRTKGDEQNIQSKRRATKSVNLIYKF